MTTLKTNHAPLVSIVTPVYNAERFLKDTIATVQHQSYTNWELLLVDDLSTDGSTMLINRFAKNDDRIKLIRMEKNSGAAAARNTGVANAKGTYVAYLDADDLWNKNKLKKQIEFMTSNNHVFTFTGYEFANEAGLPTGKKVFVPRNINYRQSLKNHIIWTSTVVVDVSKVDKKYLQMPDVRRGQDAATWWQLLRQVGKAHGVNETLAYYRRTNSSLSANKFKAINRTWYLFTKVEKLSFLNSVYYFTWYAYNAVRKRT